MNYDFSVNITVKEIEEMLVHAKAQGEFGVIGVHFKKGAFLCQKKVSDTGSAWKDCKSHIDITDYESA